MAITSKKLINKPFLSWIYSEVEQLGVLVEVIKQNIMAAKGSYALLRDPKVAGSNPALAMRWVWEVFPRLFIIIH